MNNLSGIRFYHTYFEGSVISAAWLAAMRERWQDGDLWKTGRDLVRERSDIITQIVPAEQFTANRVLINQDTP